MASTVYYGKSDTGANVQAKIVVLVGENDTDFTTNPIKEGDLLTVFFTYGNACAESSLVLRTNQNGEDINISGSQGDPVHSVGIQSTKGAWQAGETVTFIYTADTSISNGTDNSYCWETNKGGLGTAAAYGMVKLDDTTDAEHSAMSYAGVQSLISSGEVAELSFNPAERPGQEISPAAGNCFIGALSLGTQKVYLEAPDFVASSVELGSTGNGNAVTNIVVTNSINQQNGQTTSQLQLIKDETFLTKTIPGNVSFVSSGGEVLGIKAGDTLIYEPTDANGNNNIFSNGNITLNPASGKKVIVNNTGIDVGGPIAATGNITTGGAIAATSSIESNISLRAPKLDIGNQLSLIRGNLQVDGNITTSSNVEVNGQLKISTNNLILSGQNFTAKVASLFDRTKYDKTITIEGNKNLTVEIPMVRSGYKYLSISNLWINNGANGLVGIYGYFIQDGTTLHVTLHNFSNSNITCDLHATLLYIKNNS